MVVLVQRRVVGRAVPVALRSREHVAEPSRPHALRRLGGPELIAVGGLLGEEAVGRVLQRVPHAHREQRAAVRVGGPGDGLDVVRVDEAAGGVVHEDDVGLVRDRVDARAHAVGALQPALDDRADLPAQRSERLLDGRAVLAAHDDDELSDGRSAQERRGGALDDRAAADPQQRLVRRPAHPGGRPGGEQHSARPQRGALVRSADLHRGSVPAPGRASAAGRDAVLRCAGAIP